MSFETVKTKIVDGIYWATYDNPTIGCSLDARGPTEGMALANIRPLIVEAHRRYMQQKFAKLRDKWIAWEAKRENELSRGVKAA